MSDVVYVSENYLTSETDNEIPEEYQTVDEIVKFWSRKKIYRVRFKRTRPKWLESDESEIESKKHKGTQKEVEKKIDENALPKKETSAKDSVTTDF